MSDFQMKRQAERLTMDEAPFLSGFYVGSERISESENESIDAQCEKIKIHLENDE